jgi:hypothetical protein
LLGIRLRSRIAPAKKRDMFLLDGQADEDHGEWRRTKRLRYDRPGASTIGSCGGMTRSKSAQGPIYVLTLRRQSVGQLEAM